MQDEIKGRGCWKKERKSSCLENLGGWVKEDEAREEQTEKEHEKEGGINKEN